MQWILLSAILVGEKISSVQHGIAQILECGPVKLVGAALGNDAHLSTSATPELRSSHAGLHGKLLHTVGDPEVAKGRVDLCVDVADTIEQEDVRLRAGSGHVEASTLRTCG